MNYFIVHAHPEPKSFNGAMTRHAMKILEPLGHKVKVSDLYAMQFNPISDRRNFITEKDENYYKQQMEELYATEKNGFADDIKAEMEKLEWCDILIFQFPLWWFSLPAVLKGWVDKVFAMGKIYGRGKWYDNGAFRGKRVMLSITTGGAEYTYNENGLHGKMDTILFPIHHGIFHFTGFTIVPPFIAWSPAHITEAERHEYLEQYGKRLLAIPEDTPIQYNSLQDYDENFRYKK